MKRSLYSAVCLAALLCLGQVVRPMPVVAQQSVEVSFDSFHAELAQYGDWVYSDRWGEVWLPGDVPDDFRPYDTDGHWVYTDYGWTWASDYEWGDIPFHYGRWVYDPDDGWLWIPGYVWSPAWVVWRSNDQMIGWMPMPPDRSFLEGAVDVGPGGVRIDINFGNTDNYYGYRDWYGPSFAEYRFAAAWVFVGTAHFADRDYHRYVEPRANYTTIIRNTTNITNYTVQNNYIVNKSVDVHKVEQVSGRQVQPVRAAEVLHKAQFVAPVDKGRQAQAAAASEAPHGTGRAGSAPAPTPTVVQRLSNKLPERKGAEPSHLYTRSTVQNAPVAGKPAANPAAAPGKEPGQENASRPAQQEMKAGPQPPQGQREQLENKMPPVPPKEQAQPPYPAPPPDRMREENQRPAERPEMATPRDERQPPHMAPPHAPPENRPAPPPQREERAPPPEQRNQPRPPEEAHRPPPQHEEHAPPPQPHNQPRPPEEAHRPPPNERAAPPKPAPHEGEKKKPEDEQH